MAAAPVVQTFATPVPAPVPVASQPPVVSAPPVAAPVGVAAIETAPVPVPDPVPVPAPVPVAIPSPLEETMDRMPDVPVPAPVFDPVAGGEAGDAQRAVVEALEAAGQSSAADALGDAAWSIVDGDATVQTQLSKTMLPVVINQEAEKLVRNTLRARQVPRLTLLAGAARASTGAKKPRAAKSGSAQAKAAEHPMVVEAQRLFDAEIQTVIDLSGQD